MEGKKITDLPVEIIVRILEFDDTEHVFMSGLSCKYFHIASSFLRKSSKPLLSCKVAAGNGWLSVLEWTRKHGYPWDARTCMKAARGGHLEVLKWAREHGCPWNEFTCYKAAQGGHMEVLQWAIENGCHWNKSICCAAARNHVEVLQWLREYTNTMDIVMTDRTAVESHVEFSHFLYYNLS